MASFEKLTFCDVALDDENSEVLGRSPSLRAPAVHGESSFKMYLLREALFPSVGTRNSVVRSFVRPFVRKIIHFCEGDMEGASPLLSTGSLNF